ncbi:MAG TPA: hypothetical protein VFF62_06675 [Candidatus Nitrosocosmicus sp.]|nr:hypothetical protein [Candidatus Nitrosocosmicus sp.]
MPMFPALEPTEEVGIYPADLAREVVCRGGARVRLRPIRPADAPRLATPWARFLAEVDYRRHFALVLEQGPEAYPESRETRDAITSLVFTHRPVAPAARPRAA